LASFLPRNLSSLVHLAPHVVIVEAVDRSELLLELLTPRCSGCGIGFRHALALAADLQKGLSLCARH
jgi:hypothetical protein